MQVNTKRMEAVYRLWDVLAVIDICRCWEEYGGKTLLCHGLHPEVDIVRVLEVETICLDILKQQPDINLSHECIEC